MILGVDIGTTVTKAALIGRDGKRRALARRASRVFRTPDGRAEQDLDEVVASVAAVVREVAASAGGPIEAIALTGQGDGLWLRDADGNAVRPPISWLDARASATVDAWSAGENSVTEQLFELTGSGVFPGSHAGLLAVLAAEEPQSLAAATVAGYCTDAVLQRLTSTISVDASDASLPFLDVRSRRYVDEALVLCGVGQWRHLLAEPARPHRVFTLDDRGSALLGLPVGTPVTAGPYDLQSCSFGSGAVHAGDGTLVIGTTLSCQVLTTDATATSGGEPAGMWLCTPDPDLFLRVMPSMVGTAGLDWLLDLFGLEPHDVDGLLGSSPPGANGVRALSFLSPSGERAPFVDPRARGRFDGLQLGAGRADLVRALCESIAYLARLSFETLGLSGELSICGGGSRSDAWTQLFADVLGRDIHRPHESEVGARGAARVAWEALGKPVDAAAWDAQRRVFHPHPEAAEFYDTSFARYRDELSGARVQWQR
jgi:xylulokinase/erythritol kinase